MEDEIKPFVRFLGGDVRFWQGVPAHDLTLEEWQEVDEELQNTLLQIELYELVDPSASPAVFDVVQPEPTALPEPEQTPEPTPEPAVENDQTTNKDGE